MLGGSASISDTKGLVAFNSIALNSVTEYQIIPTVGYFLKDKFVIGLKPSFSYSTNNSGTYGSTFRIGPFSRYYFLDSEKIFNLFAEGGYTYGIMYDHGNVSTRFNTFSISGGSVLYFNSSVGLEFTLGYSRVNAIAYPGSTRFLRFEIGFQFHLEKN